MAGVIWDRFGQDVILVPDGPEHFTVSVPWCSAPVFGWLFGLETGVTVVAPPPGGGGLPAELAQVTASIRLPVP